MRTLKKTLCLVLALVMVLGLCAVSVSATDFPDDEKIEHQEAVEVMNSLGIIQGRETGNFDPQDRVTRAEMAKMITMIMQGDVDVSAFQGTPTDLKDIDGHWAEAYIKFCVSQGIVSGRGDGTFDPNNYVTTSEASKMLLVALGYNSDVRGYTGKNWQINVARDAQNKDIYDKLADLDANKQITRDEAAQMNYNTLNATRIVHVEKYNSDGVLETTYEDATNTTSGGKTLLNKTYEAKNEVAYMTSVSYNEGKDEYNYSFTNTNNGRRRLVRRRHGPDLQGGLHRPLGPQGQRCL